MTKYTKYLKNVNLNKTENIQNTNKIFIIILAILT